MPSYKVEFFDKLFANVRKLENQLTADKGNNLTKTVKNTCLFARALHDSKRAKNISIPGHLKREG